MIWVCAIIRKRSKLRLCLSLFNVWSKTVNPCNDYIHLKSFKWTSFSQNEVRHNLPPTYIYLYVNVGGSTLSYPIRHQQWCMIYLCLVVVDTVNTYMYLFVQLKSCYRPMNRHTSLMSFNTHMGPMWGLLNLAPKFPMLRLLCRKERYLYYANGQFVRQACKAFMPFRKGLYTASKQLDWLSNHSA